ncbi:MAG: hypothetical protein ACPL1I_09565, partial [bacterium]
MGSFRDGKETLAIYIEETKGLVMNLSEISRKLDGFLEEIERIKNIFLPSLKLVILTRRINFIKIRIELDEDIFLDIYYNAENDRKDFAVILRGRRVLGYDNLEEWHKHPFESPNLHLKCEEPDIEEIFMVRRRKRNTKDRSKVREFDVIAVCNDKVIINE